MSTTQMHNEPKSVTKISASSRIDYILRFSKHAVLVIDNNPEVYADVGNEFLGSLSKEHNAAFVSISSKLNDIQIRCRIIEQLFGNTLFDPEQPLSVNVVKLSEAKNEAITIVIANVESLSLQLTHELCQLAEIAKKLDKTINVLLLGNVQAAINLSENKHLFEDKISILLAESGQLVSLNSSLLKNKTSILGKNKSIKIFLALLILIFLSVLAFTYITATNNDELSSNTNTVIADEYKKDFVKVISNKEEIKPVPEIRKQDLATTEEIFKSLMTQNNMAKIAVITLEDTTDTEEKSVIKELSNSKNLAVDEFHLQQETELSLTSTIRTTEVNKTEANNKELKYFGNEKYYQNIKEGFVIQLASFEKQQGFKYFLNTYANNDLYGYTRELKGTISHIVTTKVYNTNIEAKMAIEELPQDLRSRGPWIKSLQAVNNEINLYQQLR